MQKDAQKKICRVSETTVKAIIGGEKREAGKGIASNLCMFQTYTQPKDAVE